MIDFINLISLAIAVIAVIYLIYVITIQTAKGLRTGFLLLAVGIFISVAMHSLFETLERLELIGTGPLIQIMPVLVLIGSLLILAGAYTLYMTFKNIKKEKE